MASITVNYTIPFGAHIRIGYRVINSSNPFVYVSGYPAYNESPYEVTGIPTGSYEIELATICPNCSGGIYSEPIIVPAQTEEP